MPPTNKTAASSHRPLGVNMTLPPGSSSILESKRAEELRRRKQKNEASSSNNNPPNPPRRLAPQRKKASIANITKNTPPTTSKDLQIAVVVSSGKEEEEEEGGEGSEKFFDDERCSRDNDGDVGNKNNTRKNVADWTTLPKADHKTKESRHLLNIVKEEEDNNDNDEEDDEKEYHGEIESTTSTIRGSDEDSNSDNDDDDDDDDGFKIITEDEVSLNPPPPTTPLVLVNLEELCGCTPEDESEKMILAEQLMESLLGASKPEEENEEKGKEGKIDCGGDDEKKSTMEDPNEIRKNGNNSNDGTSHHVVLGDGLNLDFDERVVELFESGVARHVDSSHPIAISCLETKNQKCNDQIGEEGKTTKSSSSEEGEEEKAVVNPYAIVPYPEFLSSESSQQQQPTRSTLRLWKLLHTIPTIAKHDGTANNNDNNNSNDPPDRHPEYTPLLTKLFAHLRNTSRSLLWKADMHHELSLLSRREHRAKLSRTRRREYNTWSKEGVRRERLEKLYDVRETFTLQVGVAKKKYDAFVEEREGRVERELRRRGLYDVLRRRKDGGGGELLNEGKMLVGGVCGQDHDDDDDDDIDNDGSIIDECDDDGWGNATVREEDIVGEGPDILNQEEEEDENDEWSPMDVKVNPLGMSIALDGIKTATTTATAALTTPTAVDEPPSKEKNVVKITNKLELISHHDNIKRKSERLQKKQDQITSSSSSSYNTTTPTTKQSNDYFQRQQESIREMLKTNDERIAETTYLKLQERLQNVDDLLERLQEEEWAEEEEEGIIGGTTANADEYDQEEELANGSTLLDQILAMILGGLPPEGKSTSPRADKAANDKREEMEHYRFIREEHKSIVKDWLAAFGRLPPFPSDEEPEAVDLEEPPLDGNNVNMPFGDGFSSSEAQSFHAIDYNKEGRDGAGASAGKKNIDLTPIDNDESNWDEVEDWDALFP